MTLKNALNLVKDLLSQTTKKSEIQLYEKFLHILSKLKTRDFSKDEMHSIEMELESLKSNPEDQKKQVKKVVSEFEHFLIDSFALTPKGHYTNMGLVLGSTIGVFTGIVALSVFDWSMSVSLGICLGSLIGLLVGHNMDSKAKATGNLL